MPARFVTAFAVTMAAQDYCLVHQHAWLEVIYHARGHGLTHYGAGQRYAFSPGDVVIHPAGERHDERVASPATDHCLLLEVAPAALPPPECLAHGFPVASPYLLRELNDLHSWSADRDQLGQAFLDCRASALWLALRRELLQGQGEATAAQLHAHAARRYLLTLLERVSRIEDVAAALGLSADYLRHLFRATFGIGPKQFLLQARVARAGDLLRGTPRRLKDIAPECGFASERELCTTFRALTGTTPAAYRRAAAAAPVSPPGV